MLRLFKVKINEIGREASVANVCHIVHLYFNLTFWIICDFLRCLPPTGNGLLCLCFFSSSFNVSMIMIILELLNFRPDPIAWGHTNSFIEPYEQSNPGITRETRERDKKNYYLRLTLTRCQFAYWLIYYQSQFNWNLNSLQAIKKLSFEMEKKKCWMPSSSRSNRSWYYSRNSFFLLQWLIDGCR